MGFGLGTRAAHKLPRSGERRLYSRKAKSQGQLLVLLKQVPWGMPKGERADLNTYHLF